jgi:hypothetical protein
VPLSDDQRALLRLLAKREEGYEDIAALKGLSVDDLRAEVNDALAKLESAGEAPPPPPPPEPPVVEKAPAEPVPEPEPAAAPKPRVRPGTAKLSGPASVPVERRRLVLLAGGALAVVAIVLGAIALIGGGGDGGSDSTATTAGSETELTAAENGKVTQAVLTAADGSDASGRAVFGRVGKKEIVLQVSESGQLGARFPIPAELLAYVASGAFDQIYVSRTSDAAYQQEVATAKQNKSLPRYTGETVLTGEITGPVAKSSEGG